MTTTSIFLNNQTQAVRLPQGFTFPAGTKRVSIRKRGNEIIIAPVGMGWDAFFSNDEWFTDDCTFERGEQVESIREELL
jgi:antitoxin VapB